MIPPALPLRLFATGLLLVAAGLLPALELRVPAGRIASSHDGNVADKDDYGASAMVVAMVARAGLADRLVHFQYNNNLSQDNDAREAIMRESALGAAQRFKADPARFFDCQTQLAATIEHFRQEGNRSTAADPLWFICAGPMEVPWRCLNAVDPDKRRFIHVISHSPWNENEVKPPSMTHDWASLDALGVVKHDIAGQNKGIWYTAESSWSWLKNHADPDLRWLYARDQITDKFDVSDAGMAYWLLTGGPSGGIQTGAVMSDVRALLEGKAVAPIFRASAGSDQTVALNGGSASVVLDGSLSGIPAGATPTQRWSQVSGPAAAIIAAPLALDTTATATVAGTYTFRLDADAGGLSAGDQVVITVSAEPVATNTRPQVAVGPDAELVLVGGTAVLAIDASVSDDGQPNGVLTWKWTRPSGPAPVAFSDPKAEDTQVTFTVPGTYKLKLAVSDGALTGTDSLLVIVLAAGNG